jgi:hypothetical protein
MPYDDAEADDPQLLVGVGVPGDAASTREMARAFADEFAQLGFRRERLLRLFASPFYAGAYAARQLLGDAEIEAIVEDSVRVFGGRSYVVLDANGGEREAPPHDRRAPRVP